jgi:hypothetical protein
MACGFLICLAFACQTPAQVAKRDCRGAGTISLAFSFDDSYSSATVAYQLADPKAFSTAWIEVWDRPKLLFRTEVPVKRQGRIVWAPKDEMADTPYALEISVHDPEVTDLTNDSRVLIGSPGPVEGGAVPELLPETVILEEGGDSPYVTSKGKDLGEHNTLILLMEQESPQTWIAREYLPAVLADLEHVRVQIPSGYLSNPTVLQLEAKRVGDDAAFPVGSQVGGGFNFTTIYVMSKDRPLFSTIEPSEVSAADAKDGVTVRILGSGFTTESQVLTSFQVHIGHDRDALKPFFIDSRELQVTIPSYLLLAATSSLDSHVQLWVRNGDDQHVSDPQTLRLLPTAEFPLAGAQRPSIVSTSPYPVPLMDYRSPAFTLLKIYGENFRKGDNVVAANGDSHWDGKLRTEFISPQELNAWLPRELWRHHRLSFRLTALTSNGMCAAELWEEEW